MTNREPRTAHADAPLAQLLRSRPGYVPPTVGERVVVVADLLAPSRHPRAVMNLLRFVGDWQPDRVVVMSARQHGSTHKGSECATSTLARLRAVYSGDIVIQAGAGAGRDALTVGSCSCWHPVISDLGLAVTAGIHPVAPGWLSLSATGPGVSRYPGALAILLARGFGHSIICSGTSGLALIGEIPTGDSTADTLWGFEIGTLRCTAPSTASSFRPAMGFGVVDSTTGIAEPTAVAISRSGAFTFDGVTYAA
ncbi:hypothetical protein [Kitasatospora cineracea]|uniref:hypothetical protein n=1 Tax=Kitasatospora cineracea TaxID=88074 RepID=UPI0011CE6270|nr:hypothetical protein [Kitasatospora cineracea]